MNKLLLLTTILAFCTMSAHAKPSKITQCNALFSTTLSEAGPSSEYGGGAELVFDIKNKSKKGIYAIDGVVFVQAKGDKGKFIFTNTMEWSEPVEKDETGNFTIHVSPTGMTLSAIANARPVSVGGTMLYATVLYEDGEMKKCGNHDALVLPLIPYS